MIMDKSAAHLDHTHSRSARIPALGLLAFALLQQALHDATLHLVLAPALTPLGVAEDRARIGLHAVGFDGAGRRGGRVVLVRVLGLVTVLRLGLVSMFRLGVCVRLWVR